VSGNYNEGIYDEKKLEKKMERLIELLERSPDSLTERDLDLIEALLRETLTDIPAITRTGIEKRRLYEILKMVLEDLKRSRSH